MSAGTRVRELADRLDLGVPNELREVPGWLLWKAGPRDPTTGKFDKVPYYVSGGKRFGTQGNPEDREKITTFEVALARLREGGYDGLGLAMLGQGIVGLDFDSCRDAAGIVAPWVLDMCSSTYAEISPSGTGVRVFYRGTFLDRKNHSVHIETFCRKGFLTVTGARLNGCDLAELPKAVADELGRRLGPDKARSDSAEVLREACARDPMLARLNERGMVLRDLGGGKFDITCPFESEHSTRGGSGDTVYYTAHTGGYAGGNFDCKHSHCAERPQSEFRAKLGLGGGEDPQLAVARLAALTPIEYDRVRQAESDALGVRVTILDGEIAKVRREIAGDGNDSQGEAVLFQEIEPWHEPVDGAKLLTDLATRYRRHIVLAKHAPAALALWTLFTHAIPAVNVAAILVLTSPEKRCGKSTALTMISRLVPRSLPFANISPSALFRAVEAWSPTLLMDEAESFLRNNEEARGIIDSGHTRDLAYVIRNVGEDHEPRRFSTWGAKAIALIGKLPDTIADRSIEIQLKRKLRGERVERLRHADPDLFRTLAQRCARFAADHAEKIRAARPSVPEGLHDRAADNWEPLLAIADLAGGRWPERARAAALALSGGEDTDSDTLRVQLLTDIRDVFEGRNTDRISSEDLTVALVGLEERPWAEYSRGTPLTKPKLARLLRPFGVVSGSKRLPDGRTPKGYLLKQFTDPFARYLPSKAQRRHNVGGVRVPEDFGNATEDDVWRPQSGPEPSCGAGCGGVADSDPPPWRTRI